MTPLAISLVVLLCIAAGALLGMALRRTLPGRHLTPDAKDVVRLGTGLIGTIAALVLGLLIASAKGSYDTQSNQVQQLTASIILLDSLLEQYGPETRAMRQLMRRGTDIMIGRIWREHTSDPSGAAPFEASRASSEFLEMLQGLAPATGAQHSLKDRAVQASQDLSKTRLLLFLQRDDSIPLPFLAILVFWLTIIFASFSLFAEPNPIVVGALAIFALSATGAIFLILEMSQPFGGLLRISSEPLHHALAAL